MKSRVKQPLPAGEIAVGVIGGLLVGYIGWLAAVTVGDELTTVGTWSVAVLLGSAALAAGAVIAGLLLRLRRRYGWSAFALGLPVLPVALTLALLANLYL